ncbi:XdhC family protein [Erythrobacter sp. Alg231-14]|uniref:XdhC family protein n=1 Tax=Erythrobacter sp. Alg231-14 TaxID=1922225 RepID=UPI000D55E86D
MDTEAVLRFLNDCHSRGQACVLVTVCAVDGSSMRNPGTIMGVAEDGRYAGSLSGGCIESAVVAEALEVIQTEVFRLVRFGKGSPYLDIKLPCGGGLDLHFAPIGSSPVVQQCLGAIAGRMPFAICIEESSVSFNGNWAPTHFDHSAQSGVFGHWPDPRLVIVGHGAGVGALSGLAATMGCAVNALTPDRAVYNELAERDVDVSMLDRVSQTDALESDPWTAIIFLFHDHDWETELMAHALSLPHFYLGAMGGRQAHDQRKEALLRRGATPDQLDAMHAPIGLFHSSRDPQTLALSTLAEVIRTYDQTDFSAALT